MGTTGRRGVGKPSASGRSGATACHGTGKPPCATGRTIPSARRGECRGSRLLRCLPQVQPPHGDGEELLPPAGGEAVAVEAVCDLPVAHALLPVHLDQLGGLPIGLVRGRVLLPRHEPLRPGLLGQVPGRAQREALQPLLLEGGPGAGADQLALVLGQHGEDADGERVGVGHVHGQEVHVAVAQAEDEPGVAAEAVELGDQQPGPLPLGPGDGRLQLGPVVALAALHLDVLGQERVAGLEETPHHPALRLQAQPALALLLCGDPVVGHVLHLRYCYGMGENRGQR